MDTPLIMLTDDGNTLLSMRSKEDGSLELLTTPVIIIQNSVEDLQVPGSPTSNIVLNEIDLNNVPHLNSHLSYSTSGDVINLELEDFHRCDEQQSHSTEVTSNLSFEESQCNFNSTVNQNLNETSTELIPSIERSPVNYRLKEVSVCLERIPLPKKYIRKKVGRPKKGSVNEKEVLFKCYLCGQEFTKQNLYQKHVHDHSQDKPHRCPKCPASFNVPTNFTLHMATHNIGEPKCPECGRKFARIASLKSHIVVHEMDESLYCTECDDTFQTKAQLEAHLSLHNEKWSSEDYRRCRLCRKQFTQPVLYRQHLRDHYKMQMKSSRQTKRGIRHSTTYKCKLCLKIFQKPSQLARHIRVHTGEKPYKCNVCNQRFTQQSSVRVHMLLHKGIRPYSCTFCPAKFSQKNNLNTHVQQVHRVQDNDSPSYRCVFCSCIFKSLSSMNGHMSRVHGSEAKRIEERSCKEADEEEEEEEAETMRANVDRVIHQLTDLESCVANSGLLDKSETENTQGDKGEGENLDVSSECVKDGFVMANDKERNTAVVTLVDKDNKYVRIKQRNLDSSRVYECSFCHKPFKKPSDLVRHIRIHTKEKPFTCKICGRSFTLKLTMQNHEKTHNEVETISCNICNIKFNYKKMLDTHIDTCHKCTLCGKRFTSRDEQNDHSASHADVLSRHGKPKNKVPAELQTLARKVVLKEPLVITESSNGQLHAQPRYRNKIAHGKGRPHQCPSCPAAFMKVSHLKQHYRRHTGERPYVCGLCDRKFSCSSALKSHYRIHERLRPYKCSICSMRFTTLSCMKRHQLTHSNKRPFMCPYCNKTFKSTANCRKHMQIHRQEIAQQQLELQKKQQEFSKVGSNPETGVKTECISFHDEPNTFQSSVVNLVPNLNNSFSSLISSPSQNVQSADQNIPVVNNSNIDSAHTLHANEIGTITLSNFTDTQMLNSENMREIEESLNQQLYNFGINLELNSNTNSKQTTDTVPLESQEQPVLSIIYDNGTTLQSPITLNAPITTDSFPSHYDTFDINNITLQNNIGIMQADSTNMVNNLPNSIQENQYYMQHLINGNLETNTAVREKLNDSEVVNNSLVIKEEIDRPCDIQCNIKISGVGRLKDQTKMHKKSKDFQCKYCPAKFGTSLGLDRHIKSHKIDETHKCYECNEQFSTKFQLREHIKEHVKKELKLKNLYNSEDFNDDLKKNLKKPGEKNNANTCQYCEKSFRKRSDLIRHIRTHTGERPYQCQYCEKSFAVKCTLDSHMKTHGNEESFLCNVCNKNFSTKGSLKVHMRLHTGLKPFKCTKCDLRFRTSGHRSVHLISHMRKGDQDPKKPPPTVTILATELDKLAQPEDSEQRLEISQSPVQNEPEESPVHQQNVNAISDFNASSPTLPNGVANDLDPNGNFELLNLGDNNQLVANLHFLLANGYVTIQTEDPASNQVSLATAAAFTGELPEKDKAQEQTEMPQVIFSAETAPDSTVPTVSDENNLSLNNYMVLQLDSIDSTVQINSETSEKPKKSPSKTSKHECDVCGKSFAKPCQVERHRRTHTGERPFKCDVCNKSFTQKSSLQMHGLRHTGDRPYKCNQCPRSFTQNGNLQTHMRRIHKVDPNETKKLAKAHQFFQYDPKFAQSASEISTINIDDISIVDLLE